MTARSTSRSRATCCCPCGLAPVVTVAAGTRWGDATPCYSSLAAVAMCVFVGLRLLLCFCSGSYYVLYKHQRRRQLAARGHCHSSTSISAFTRRPAAEGKLLLRVYLPRPVVGHRVAQATALPSGGGAEAPFGAVAVADQVL